MGSFCSRLPEQEIDPSKLYIPPEIVEQILLNLPIKSLLRFSCASTSWNSTITSPQFAAKRDRGRSMVIINPNFDLRNVFCCPLSTISDNPVRNAASSMLVSTFRGHVLLEAFCDQLWCVLVEKSTYLWNPFTGAYKKLPHAPQYDSDDVAHGLGYDAVHDDYKLLKSIRQNGDYTVVKKSFIYSSKNDSWREIPSHFPRGFPNSSGLFADGSLYWMVIMDLVTFDFSTEKFRVLKQPMYFPEVDLTSDDVDVAVLRKKLCVFVNYRRSYEDTALVLWMMADYGVAGSWTKLYEIRYESIRRPVMLEFIMNGVWFSLRPLYLYEDGRVVILAKRHFMEWDIIVYKDLNVVSHSKIVSPLMRTSGVVLEWTTRGVRGGFVYGETFASPIN